MRSCILITLTIVIEIIKVLADSGTFHFCKDLTTTVLIQILVDFLYRLKDRHPYSNSENEDDMDVFYMIMEFLIPNSYLPSAALLKEYSESKVTKKLNTLPAREYINSKFDEYTQLNEEDYELLRKRFESRPPFVFCLNPNSELQEKVDCGSVLKTGFFEKRTNVKVNKLNRLEV